MRFQKNERFLNGSKNPTAGRVAESQNPENEGGGDRKRSSVNPNLYIQIHFAIMIYTINNLFFVESREGSVPENRNRSEFTFIPHGFGGLLQAQGHNNIKDL